MVAAPVLGAGIDGRYAILAVS
ncbi:MAG: hypothetical protein JWM12_1836, partial [Ilumatobacteraceae bacterium]|nr:hypothetical protein [Ilumatobacteraceae bacterium]